MIHLSVKYPNQIAFERTSILCRKFNFWGTQISLKIYQNFKKLQLFQIYRWICPSTPMIPRVFVSVRPEQIIKTRNNWYHKNVKPAFEPSPPRWVQTDNPSLQKIIAPHQMGRWNWISKNLKTNKPLKNTSEPSSVDTSWRAWFLGHGRHQNVSKLLRVPGGTLTEELARIRRKRGINIRALQIIR